MTYDEAIWEAGPEGTIYRRFMAENPNRPGQILRTEWMTCVSNDDRCYCWDCQAEHLYISQDGEDGFCQHPSVFEDVEICLIEARKFNDWEVETSETPKLEDWNRW